jgi:hypothetical protein
MMVDAVPELAGMSFADRRRAIEAKTRAWVETRMAKPEDARSSRPAWCSVADGGGRPAPSRKRRREEEDGVV